MNKHFFSRSKWLLLTLYALLIGGTRPAWAQKAMPYDFGFETAIADEGWTKVDCDAGSNNQTTTKRSGSSAFKFKYNSAPPQYLISSELTVSKLTNISFWYKAESSTYEESFKVGYSSTTNDVASDGVFTWSDEIKTKSTSWVEYASTIPAGTKYIAIQYTANDKYGLYIDDLALFTCAKPTGLTTENITSSSVDLTWTSDAEAWNVQYKKTADSEWTDVAGNLTSKSYTLTGLNSATNYQVRVRTYCSAEDQSGWTDAVSFTTDCGVLTVDATNTFSEDFSAGSLPLCWSVNNENKGSSGNGWKISSNKAYSGYYGDTYLIMPAMTLGTNMQLTFDSYFDYVSSYNKSSVVISTTGTAAADFTTTLYTFEKSELPSSSSTALSKEISLAAYNGQTVYIAFKYEGNDAHAWYVDNIVIEQGPACPKPTGLTASNVTTQGATLSWTAGSDETEWKVIYGAAGFDPASAGTTIDNVTTNPYTLTGLTAATEYDVYVKAVKGSDVSEISNKANFTTLAATPVIELSATSHNFGMVSDADAQALTLTISNTGGVALTGLTVTPSAGFAVTDADGNALSATTIAASSTLTVKVKVNALGQQNGTITIDGTEIEAQTVNVSGYMLDNTKILETFASASSVSRWTGSSSWSFNASTGAYSGTSSRVMTSPKLTVAEGNVLALNVKLGWNGGSLIVEGLDADGNTVYDPVTYNSSNGGLNTSNFTLLTIDDMPTTVAKVKLTGYYAYINVFNGFTYVNDPQLGLFSNEACTTAQASPATKNFGFATEAQNQVYYIKNTGNGQIDLTIEQTDGFTAAVDDDALTEGEKATLTVTMTATEGLHEGTITVTAKNHDDDAVLGTFVVNANGAITGTKNNVVLTAFPAGWQNNNWAINSGAARIWFSTPSDLITTTLRVTAGDKLLVEAKKYDNTDDSQLSYSYSSDNGTSWSDAVSLTSSLGTDYKIIAISSIPAGDVLMKFTGTYAYIRQIYGFEAVSEPIIEFAAAGTTKNFGMISSKTTSDAYTITNSGTAPLNNLDVTCDNDNFEIAVADNATSIAAGSNVTFTVALKTTALGSQTGTVTISGDDVSDKTFTVKGYVIDNTKINTDFTAKPDRWENSGWTFNTSGATAGFNSNATMTSPKIVATTQKLAISAKLQNNSSSYYVKVQGYDTAESDWTYTTTLSNDVLNSSNFTVVELNDIPTTVNRIRLVGNYVIVNGLNGLTYDENDPEFGVFSDSEFNSQITSGAATNAWGFVNENKTATYYIKNTGTGTMTLSKSDAPAGFTATLGKTSLGTGQSTTLTIAMAYDVTNNEGYHTGDVVLTAKDNADNTLGTFTVTSSGVVVGSKADINFTTLSAFPAGWDGGTYWSVTANTKATIGYNSGTLTTGTYSVADGESLVIKAKKQYNSGTLSYQYSTDGGETWSSTQSITPSSTSYELVTISNIPTGSAKIKFTGTYIDIERIYGFTAVLEPAMTLSPADANHDFGMQTAAANYEITVTNSGTAAMENMKATLSGTDAADFDVALSVPDGSLATITDGKANVPIGQAVKVTATLKASTEYKTHNATLTISADGDLSKTVTLSGKTRDADKWYVDFASEIPSSFVENGSWSVSSGTARTTASEENSLITQPINLAANEKIYFDACNPYSGSLKVRYSVNGGISWSDYVDYSSAISTTSSTFSSHEIDLENASAVTAIVEFKGRYYIQLDNIYGGTLNNTAPMIKVTKSAVAVENGATEAFGSIMTETSATYTITNVGNGTLTITSPITTVTGVATAAVDKTSLANGESATLTITMPAEAPYGAKDGFVTVATSLGDFVINYNATILNPNALDEQFASGKPAGWYFGGQWTVASNQASNDDSGIADLITEQLHVAGTSDALTFKAKRTSSYTAPTWSVSYSTDRVNWTDVDVSGYTLSSNDYTTITVNGLDEGDYYLRIRANRLYVDNFLGWTKKNNTHDLYVTATSFPTTSQLVSGEITPSATVTSLIAAETGVYAKLFIDGAEAASTKENAKTIAKDGTQTFSFNYTLPATVGTVQAQIKIYYSDDTEAFATAVNDIVVDYPSLSLYETDASLTLTAGTYNVKLDHDFVEGWNTVCLPFKALVSQIANDAVAYAFTSYDATNNVLNFTKVTTTLTAGQPYVVYTPSAFTTDLQFNGVTITDQSIDAGESASNGVAFKGTYTRIAAGGMTGNWGVTSEGRIQKAGSGASIKGFRAYFTGISSAAPSLSFFDMTTGIKTVIGADELNLDGEVYNLNGQKVQNAHKGIFIKNGKKVFVK